jgi:hypothetical protein
MEVPNLTNTPIPEKKPTLLSLPLIIVFVVLAITSGFWLSRFFPNLTTKNGSISTGSSDQTALSTDDISSSDQLQIGKLYGDTIKTFSDSATGTIEKGSINGEGTHILNREGGLTQRASLTSSTVDLDLFVGKKVEVKGQTNSSTKTGWLLDVGSIKILE